MTDAPAMLPTSRRRFIRLAGTGVCATALAPLVWIAPAHASVSWAALAGTYSVPPAEDVDATIRRLFGTREVEYSDAKVKLTVPNVAENGAVVPTELELLAPPVPPLYVKRIVWVIDRNKRPHTVMYDFTEETGIGYAAAYVRMGETSRVRGVVELSDGRLLGAWKEVAVITGGCGG